MAQTVDRSNFMIGLFVMVGILIGIVAVVWLGVAHYFAPGDRYVTYFDESVQGLSPDSTVKYRGVTVGRVEKIAIAPDNRLIEVMMKVELDTDPSLTTVAQLRPVGITGMVFVELNLRDREEPRAEPLLSFEAPYPVIPSRPSGISEIFSRLHLLADKVMDVDIAALTDEIRSAAAGLGSILSNPGIVDIIENLDAAAARLDRTLAGLEQAVIQEQPEKIMSDIRETLAEGRHLIAEAGRVIREADIPETSKQAAMVVDALERKVSGIMDSLDRTARVTALEIRDAGFQLRQAARAVEELSERLALQPSDLIFGRPPARDEEGE